MTLVDTIKNILGSQSNRSHNRLSTAKSLALLALAPFAYQGVAHADHGNTSRKAQIVKVQLAKGDELFDQRKYHQAIEIYTKALKLAPKSVLLRNNRGMAHRRLGNLDKALADFDAGLKAKPYSPILNVNRGHTAYDLGERQKDKKLATSGLHSLYVGQELAVAYESKGTLRTVLLPEFTARAKKAFPRLDTSKKALGMTPTEMDTLGRKIYRAKEWAACHYLMTKVHKLHPIKDRRRSAGKILKRLNRKMKKAGVKPITVASAYK